MAARGPRNRGSEKDNPGPVQDGDGVNLRGLLGPAVAKKGGMS